MAGKLEKEADSIQEHLKDKCIVRVMRPRDNELCIESSDGTRLFVNSSASETLDFSITGGAL
ncbi:hypothetical protein [Teredinibacter purpureus]|uniref:hypothetical protein n=1 Tax=Teredinibacter purpureus TaxID=2731756 RepID=UPI0005F83A58|nr:hypothetical protein [Teredinibacter purpureus]